MGNHKTTSQSQHLITPHQASPSVESSIPPGVQKAAAKKIQELFFDVNAKAKENVGPRKPGETDSDYARRVREECAALEKQCGKSKTPYVTDVTFRGLNGQGSAFHYFNEAGNETAAWFPYGTLKQLREGAYQGDPIMPDGAGTPWNEQQNKNLEKMGRLLNAMGFKW